MELNKIKTQVAEVLKYSQDFKFNEPKVDALIEDWYEAKKDFIDIIGEKLIYEYPEPICFEMNEDDKIKNVEDFITQTEYQYKYLTNIQEIIYFFEENKINFYTNQTNKEFVFYDKNSKEKITIPKGIKINKALKFFIPDKEILTDLQMSVSRVIQKDKIKGILCISVHPLDFLSSSENIYNWRSCHALDGEYRMGNLSYMVDKSTVICYLKSKEKYKLPNFPSSVLWNSKKWRVLIHFSNDKEMIFSGRQYPFSSDVGLNLILEKLFPAAGFYEKWSKWDNTTITDFKGNNGTILHFYSPLIPVHEKLISLNELVKNGQHALNYNDVLYSNYYTPYYSYCLNHPFVNYYTGGTTDETRFEIGGPVKCLCCESEYITISEAPRCISCEEKYGTEPIEGFVECAECGERVFGESATYVENVGYICNSCLDQSDSYVECYNCGYIVSKKEAYEDEDGNYYCHWCARF